MGKRKGKESNPEAMFLTGIRIHKNHDIFDCKIKETMVSDDDGFIV